MADKVTFKQYQELYAEDPEKAGKLFDEQSSEDQNRILVEGHKAWEKRNGYRN